MTQENNAQTPRVSQRHRVVKAGKILANNNLTVVDCRVRDLSARGARLVCGEQMSVPTEFRLVMPADNMMRHAHVIWRRGNEIGIVFDGEATPNTAFKI